MQKIFINKNTNMVEQILYVESVDELPDNYFSTCYAVLDLDDKVNGYNLKYNNATESFEEVEGIKAFEEVEVKKQPTIEDYNSLKEENEELKNRLDKVEGMINKISEVTEWQVK